MTAELGARTGENPTGDGGGEVRSERDDIVAISKFGFFSIDANVRTTIYVDNVRLGETPMKRAPLATGPHRVKAVAEGKKPREFVIEIVGGRDFESGVLTW